MSSPAAAQRKQLDRIVENSKKSLWRALKLARGFERQKLGRRQKMAKQQSHGENCSSRLDAEIAALKVGGLIFSIRVPSGCG